jgi:hypothetical protein
MDGHRLVELLQRCRKRLAVPCVVLKQALPYSSLLIQRLPSNQ